MLTSSWLCRPRVPLLLVLVPALALACLLAANWASRARGRAEQLQLARGAAMLVDVSCVCVCVCVCACVRVLCIFF